MSRLSLLDDGKQALLSCHRVMGSLLLLLRVTFVEEGDEQQEHAAKPGGGKYD